MKKVTSTIVLFLLFIFLAHAEGSDEIIVIVNKENPLAKISRAELIKIYLGKKSLFENGSKIIPVDLTEEKSLRTQFYETILGKDINKLKNYWIKRIFSGQGSPPQVLKKIEHIKNFVANTEGGIGYIRTSDIDNSVKAVKINKK